MPAAPELTEGEKSDRLIATLDDLLNAQQKDFDPGVSIRVVSGGQTIYSRSKGRIDTTQNTAITENTTFELASVSKSITAVAVMQLAERKLLTVNDSVLKWLPELPESWRTMTIHHLLSHQSGIPDYLIDIPINQLSALDGLTNAGLIERFRNSGRLDFLPGANAAYSSSNYVLLAEIVARASGQSITQYMKTNIFDPARMHSTYLYGSEPTVKTPIALNMGRDRKIIGITMATVGAIGVFSTVVDLSAFIEHLLAGDLISAESLEIMTTIQSRGPVLSRGEYYGYGWFMPSGSKPFTLFAHSGRLDGYRNLLRVNHAKEVYCIVLSNGGAATDKILEAAQSAVQSIYD